MGKSLDGRIKRTKPVVKMRYFFVCTAGKEFNNSMSFNAFDYKTTNGNYPTISDLIGFSESKFVGQREVILISITEMSEADWKVFVSSQ